MQWRFRHIYRGEFSADAVVWPQYTMPFLYYVVILLLVGVPLVASVWKLCIIFPSHVIFGGESVQLQKALKLLFSFPTHIHTVNFGVF